MRSASARDARLEALAWANALLVERGLPARDDLPPGVRTSPRLCSLALCFPAAVVTRGYLTLPGEAPIPLPRGVQWFERLFDAGEFPDLERVVRLRELRPEWYRHGGPGARITTTRPRRNRAPASEPVRAVT